MNTLKTLNTKYGIVIASNNSKRLEILDDCGVLLDTFPVGMVLRWKPSENSDPSIKFIEGVFTTDFEDDHAIERYINENNLLD